MQEHSSVFDLKKNKLAIFATLFFVILTIWWITIYSRSLVGTSENNFFTLLYPLLSLFGGITGIFVSKKWGGFSSLLGKAIMFFSFGLLAQFFGQASYAYYIYVSGIEVPYPSIGDLGYFGSIIFYILGIWNINKVIGIKSSLNNKANKIWAIIIPLIMLACSYYVFLQGYVFDWSKPLIPILDFGYPFGQAIYVSMAIVALALSKKFLGGIMKMPIILLLTALITQYISDFVFLYQAHNDTWYVGGPNDYMYLISYQLMTISLIYIGHVFEKIRNN